MTPDFVHDVALMRTLQKEWFRTKAEERPPDLLRRCKLAEKRVDQEIERMVDGQQELFPGHL